MDSETSQQDQVTVKVNIEVGSGIGLSSAGVADPSNQNASNSTSLPILAPSSRLAITEREVNSTGMGVNNSTEQFNSSLFGSTEESMNQNLPAGFATNHTESSSMYHPETATDRIEIDLFGSRRTCTLSKKLAENVSKVTFPYFDPEQLKSIKLDLPFPKQPQTSMFLPTSPTLIHTGGRPGSPPLESMLDSRPNNQLVHVSHCRRQARLARQQVLFKIGMRSHISENKKMLSAVQIGDIAKVSGMLHSGTPANISDQKRRTPLHIAASQGHFAIASLLLAMHGDPNNQDILGNTPLHLAVCRSDLAVVKLLIENGANIHTKDNAGRTPFSIVNARLNTMRKDPSTSTEKLKDEVLVMWAFLKFHEKETPETTPVSDLCQMMENVSTREQADEIADVMISKMSGLCLANQQSQTSSSVLASSKLKL